uniref:Uncharacterized protein n=1 Tax=Meloidogyne enterolobii TaxID=390850 RepID=A0A6V7WHM5_MELEN|nr:unnamed protein product [Meloidogyne enterolobii]
MEGEPAMGVEQCFNCAKGYTGRSCQQAAPGFFIAYITDYLNQPNPIVLSGMAMPCDCHSHSQLCDPKTGECIECLHNTIGTRCERCKDGYYGNALSGLPDACHRCLCPLEDNSLSSKCIASESSGRGYYCTECNPGHVGMYCESCEAGYYGNPLQSGGHCIPCACHPHGSLSTVCHNITGQCQCREGVEGRACSICSPRHAFLNGVCTSCDQGCYRELMLIEDDMEKQLLPLHELLSKSRPIPHKRLARIRTSVITYSSLLDSIGGEGFNSLVSKPELSWAIPLTEGKGFEGSDDPTSRSFRHAHILAEEFRLLQERNNESLIKLGNLENNLNKIRAKVKEENKRVIDIVNQLSQFVHRSGQSTSSSQLQYWLDQAESLLNASRERMAIIEKKYNYAKKNAEEAERLLNEITARKLNTTSYEHLAEKHREYQLLIKEFRNILWDEARTGSLAAKNTSLVAEGELENLQKIIEEIEKYIKLVEEEINNGNLNIFKIEEKIKENEEIGKEIKNKLILKIKNLREEELQNLEGDFVVINELKQTRMPLAEKHALELEKQALKLKGQFSDTQIFSMDALAASNVYELIINLLQNATMSTASARYTTDTAINLIDPKEDNSLFLLSNISATKSLELNNKVDLILQDLGVKEQSNRLWNNLDNLGNVVLAAQKNISLMRDVQQLLEDHHDRISTVFTAVDDAREGLDLIEETIIEFNEDVEGIKQRVNSIQHFTSSSIKESIKNLTENAKEVDLLDKDFSQLEEKTEEHSKQIKLLRKDLGVLKEKIDEAREKAAKIRIGVRSDVGSGCIREFLSPMRPTTSNTISLKYRPVMDSPDSLLLFTQVPATRTQSREYLAIELKQKKIHVKWDIGDGRREAAIIKRNIVYIPASSRYTWYYIEVKRIANTVQVSVVQRLSVGGDSSRDIDEPTQVVVGKPDVNSDVIFNVIPGQTRLSLGLRDKSLAEELGFSTNKFLGTVGELNVDGVNVALWVFSKTEGMCEGATGPPMKTATGHFFRNGFAQIRFPVAERSSSMLAVQFSAYSPNGLLYFRGSPTSGEFIGLELHEGAISLKADFGPQAKIALQLNGTNYADGRAHKVRVIRRDGEVHLQADPEADHISIALDDSKALLDITESDHFVGGVPPDFPTAHFLQDHDLNFEGFFGCIHSVRPNQLSELDLDNPLRAQRKEAGCRYQEERLSTSERIIGFQGIDGGFLKTRGILLDSDSTFSFNFRTKSLNAILLYQSADLQKLEQQRRAKRRRRTMKEEEELKEISWRERRGVLTNPNDQSFLAFYLIDGRLTIHLGTDSEERVKRPVISSTQTYSDGLLHSVFLSRMGKEIQVRINDREVLATILDDERSIGGDRWNMLLGGVPSRLQSLIQDSELGTVESLAGCLSDFQLDYERLPIILEEHYGTILGSCSLEDGINEIIYENKNPAKDEPLINFGEEEEEDKYSLQQQQLYRKKSKQSLEQLAPTTVGGLLNDNKNIGENIEKEEESLIKKQCNNEEINNKELKEYRFGLSESSHSKINFNEKPYPSYTNFSISFEFRTEQKKGLLWVWASYRNYSRYFILHMDRGILKLVIKGHHQIKKLNYREKRFDDGKWHKLEIIKKGREIGLKVDEFTTEKLLDAPSPKVMRRRMYIGGVINKHRRMFNLPRNRLPPSFDGCIRHFIVNGHEWDLNLSSKDIIPCAHSTGIGYIHNNGFAAFSSLDQLKFLTTTKGKKPKEAKTIELSIKFRLLSENLIKNEYSKENNSKTKGRLLFAFLASGDDWQLKPRFVLWIDDNGMFGFSLHSSPQFEHNIHIDTFNIQNNSKNPFSICPGEWHHFRLFLSAKGIKIELNDQIIKFGEQRLPLSLITQLRSLPIYVGGTNAAKSLSLGIRSLFGCVQQFEIDGESIIFEQKNAKKWHKIISNGCPFI